MLAMLIFLNWLFLILLTFFAHYVSKSMLRVYFRIYHKEIPLR